MRYVKTIDRAATSCNEKQGFAAPVRLTAAASVTKLRKSPSRGLDVTIAPMPQLRSIPHPVLTAPPRVKGARSDPQKFAVDVKASRIDGRGAFAAEAIPARRKIGEIRGEAVSVREARRRAKGVERIMIVELSDRRAIDASNSTDPLRFTNHSCQPNAVLRIRQGRVEFYAMRDVKPGEELTVNYGETHHEGKLRCRCGAAGCVGRL